MKRNASLDMAKGISAFLVVWGHLLSNDRGILFEYINAVHMPVFFFISGYFLVTETEKYRPVQLIKNKVLRLLVPYLIWSGVSLIFHLLIYLKTIPHLLTPDVVRTVQTEAVDIFVFSRSVWFLIVLFVSNLLFILVVVVGKNNEHIIYTALAFELILIWVLFPNKLFALEKLKWLYPFMIAGYIMKRSNMKLKLKVVVLFGPVFILLGLIFNKYSVWPNYNFDVMDLGVLIEYLTYWAYNICGLVTVLIIAQGLANKDKIFNRFGKFSLDIYVIHMPFVSSLLRFPALSDNYMVKGIIKGIYALAICFIITYAVERIFVKTNLYQIMTGRKRMGYNADNMI